MRIDFAGESSLIVYFDGTDIEQQNLHVTSMAQYLKSTAPDWLLDWIPSYHSLLVEFDPFKTDYLAVKRFLRDADHKKNLNRKTDTRHHILPVLYDFPGDNDLQRMADHLGLSKQDIISTHQSMQYRVFAVGFSPGFAFLGQVRESIAMPRLATPRKRVPKGAVAIADRQTAVYPQGSPGGWNIIGLCPAILFDPGLPSPATLQVGDTVAFTSIQREEFVQLGGEIDG